ncbi:methyl-accepting chemotaxis sensory transducer with Pas/Pac sensor [Halogranum rubrum]|uniref:Methyl-accepting chemotaxis sensory transducer with Pas/Pac sensor n=1 Tax=Halogranum rubrum TaxID=553466 RepID=A0A1I4HD39_9EURY|nr:methyl-accepting chemotaxis protein [Halogranum rubrum]SFL39356.1 methyl-accepting chemotaxis sensory transducer with Pas/Pac sensor [Halogranum rubrum]
MLRNSVRTLLSRLAGDESSKTSMTDGGVTVTDQSEGSPGTDSSLPDASGGEFEFQDETDLAADELNIDDDVLLDGVGMPVFMLRTDGEVVAWNHSFEQLTGVSADQALGSRAVSTVFYSDAQRRQTLAEKVLDAPETADRTYGLALEDETLSLYAEEETLTDRYGDERHFRYTSMPIYEDGDLVAVVQTVRDRTDEVRRHSDIEDLVDEVQQTLHALVDGHLEARASFDREGRVVEDRLLTVVDELNGMAEGFEDVAMRVDTETQSLAHAVERTATAANQIARNVEEQNDLLSEGASEMQRFSASMEEVAATADQVDVAATQARDAAAQGLDASEDARTATNEVVDIGDDVVRSVTDLGERMDDIEAVVEVISDVADQTNLLALNANIEAARAGEDGDGFAVVAEEVKTLADETRTHTEQITTSIEEIQAQTDSTVDAAEESHERINHAGEQISDVLEAFEEIADAIDEAADGITEVSRATDDQATTVEELTATIENVQERAEETEEAAAHIVDATDEGTDAIDELAGAVGELRGERSH